MSDGFTTRFIERVFVESDLLASNFFCIVGNLSFQKVIFLQIMPCEANGLILNLQNII